LISVSLSGRELNLGFFGRLLDALERERIFGEVEAFLLLKFIENPVNDFLVEVIATEMRIAIGRLHFDGIFRHFKDRDIEGTTTEVIHRDFFVFLLVETVGEGGRGRFIDDAADIEAGDLPASLVALRWRIVKVSWDSDNRISDFLTEFFFGIGFQLGQDHGTHFLRVYSLPPMTIFTPSRPG
jgi:hypothetical protein